MRTSPVQSYGSVTANVASATGTTALAAAKPSRLGLAVFNDSTSKLFLKAGPGATATSFTVVLAAGAYFEFPVNYVGEVTGAWETANGFARVTEFI